MVDLPVKTILKQKEKDLTTYFLEELKHNMAIRDFMDLKKSNVNGTVILNNLQRLRLSPFFKESYRPEYDVMYVMATKNLEYISCEQIKKILKVDPVIAFHKCSDINEVIKIPEAMEALEKKLIG